MRKRASLVVGLIALVLVVARIAAGATVSAPTNGQNLSADLAQNSSSGAAFTTLNNIVISESANTDIPASITNGTYVLSAPTNWRFSAGNGSVSFTAGRDITAASIAVTASTITLTITTDSNANRSDSITISGIRVQLIDGAQIPSTGNITRSGGSFAIAGITGSTNFGTLSAVAGNRTKLGVTSVNGGSNPTAGTGFPVVVRSQDQFGNPANVVALTGVSLSLAAGTGTLGGTLSGSIAAGANQLSISGVTYTKAESGVSMTATRTSGDTLTAGTSGTFTVDPGALNNFLVEAQGGGAIGTQTAGTNFNIRVTARDSLNNTVTGYGGTADITSTGSLAAGGGTTAAFGAGVLASHTVRISNTGSFTITATRTSGSENGTSNSFTVNPGSASKLAVTSVPAQAGVGSSFSVTVQSQDANGNPSAVVAATGISLAPSGAGTLSGNTDTIAAGAHTKALTGVSYDTAGSITLTASRTSGDALASSAPSSAISISARPTSTVTFPTAGNHNAAAWAAGCATAGFCGTASESNGTGLAAVELSIRRGSGNYWDGSGFNSPSEVFLATSLVGSNWSYGFGAGSFSIDGTYAIHVRATDNIGGVQLPLTSRTFTYDATAPSTVVSFPAAGATYTAGTWANPSGTASDTTAGVSSVELSIRRASTGNYWDGFGFTSGSELWHAASGTGTWSISFPLSSFGADGDYVFRVHSVDNANNTEAPTSRTVTVDTALPDTSISVAPNDPASDPAPSFVFSSNESGATFECKLDAGAYVACASPKSYAGVADGSHTFSVRAIDVAGNTDDTPATHTWTIDTLAPSAPSITASAPASPANDNDPELSGNAEAGSTVRIYTDAGCTSALAGSGAAGAFATPGLTVTVSDNTAISFYATATDAAGNTSSCSTPAFTYEEYSTPATPTGLTVAPASPANDNNPFVAGSATPGLTIHVYTTADCSGAPAATGTSAQFAVPGLSVAVAEDTTTAFRAIAEDGVGNVSACSAPVTYVEDSTPPAAPTGLDSSPGSPANDNDPELTGSAAAGSTVRLYTSTDCSGAPVASGSAASFASPGLALSVANDSSTTFRATATDDAGNTSACSAPHTYVEDSTAPAAPNALATAPGSPANDNDPEVTGSAEPGSIVRIYTVNDCSGAPAASGSAATLGGTGIAVTVADDSTTTFKATATDGAGNTSPCSAGFTYAEDSTAPSSSVSFPGAGGLYRAATWADIAGTASDIGSGVVRVELSIERLADGQFWNGSAFSGSSEDWRAAAGAASWSYSFAVANHASDGQYRVRVRAVDDAGNNEAPSSRTYTIDRAAPDTTIDGAPSDPSNDVNPSFTFLAEPGATFECSLDGGAAAACTSPKSYAGLAEAPHTFSVTAADAAGNVDPTPATRTWTIDTTDPTTSYAFPAAGGAYNQAGWNDFSGSASDAGGAGLQRVELSIRSVVSGDYWDGSAFASSTQVWNAASGTTSWTLAFPAANFPADGDYEVRVRAADNATNTSSGLLRSFSVDTVPPETTIDSGPTGDTASADATFTFSSDQSGSTFVCRLDGGGWAACATPMSYTGLSEGSHTFDVRASDPGGNTDPTEASRTWVVDTMLPAAALDTLPSWIRQTVTLTATASDSGTGVASVRFDRSPAGAGTWTQLGADNSAPYSYDFDTTSLADGLYDLRVVATDGAGNFQASSVVTNIHVDNTAPNAVLDDPGAAVAGTIALTHSSTDSGSGIDTVQFQFRPLPGGTWTDTPAAWDTTALTDGQHELHVLVTDRAGNADTSAFATTLVDNTVPSVAFTVPTGGGYVNASSNDPLTLAASANDLGSGIATVEFFACTAGGASCTSSTSLGVDAAAPYEAPWPLPADGPIYLKALATDNAARQATVVIVATVDRTLPETNLLSNPGTPSNSPTPSFTFDSNEPGTTFECRVDGASWSVCTSPHATPALADGNHLFEVRAVDAAANVDPTPSSWAWLVDSTAPTATMDDPGANLRLAVGLTSNQSDPGAFASGIASIQYEYSVADAETWVATAPAWDTTTVADGLYDVHVVVTDNAGNATTSAAVEDRRIDNTAPATSHDDPGANLRQTVALVGQASDAGSGVQQVEFQISPTGANSWTAIGSSAVAPYQVGFDTTTYADGLYDFRTVARDVAGNQTDGAPVLSRRIDNTPPTATMNDPGAYLRGTVNLTSVADDPGGSGVSTVVYEYSPAGASAWQPMSATWATDTTADGVYDLHVVVRDVAGNETISATVAGRRVDNTAPTTGHNAPAGWQSGAVTVSLGPDDAGGSGVTNTQFAVNGGSWQSGTSVNLASDGIHTISFFSTDAAGNVESPKTATVMIDSTPPPPGANDPGNYLRGDVTLSANADTGGTGAAIANVSFQYSPASAGTWSVIGVDTDSPYSVLWSTTSIGDGAYDLRFEVTDEATPPNVSTEDLASKIVDNTPPTASMGSPLNGAVVSGSVTLGVSANDANPIRQVEYFVRGSSVGASTSAPYQGSWNSASAGDGAAQIYAIVEDMAGNSTTTNTITVTADNFAPAASMTSPGAAVRGTVSLSASADGDTAQVTFERRPAGGGGWTTIGTANGAPWSTSFDTSLVVDGDYELRAIATDGGGNSGTSTAVTTKVDNTAPSGSLTAPGTGQLVGGPAVLVEASASDGGSGIASVSFQYRPSGGGSWSGIASDTSAPFQASWDTTALASGTHDLQALVTDVAGNQFTTGVVAVVVDSTAPAVTLNDPGAQISGTVALSAATNGDADVVTFSYSPAGASSWTPIASDGSTPYGVNFNTTTVADGTYDLRAVVSDSVGNTSTSVRAGVRIDNFMPVLTSSSPSNGSIVASASSVVLDFSESAAASNLLIDGNPAPCAPPCSGSAVTLNTGPLAEGSHTVTGEVTDAAGNSSSFSVSFVVGVPATPPPSGGTGGGGTPFGLPHVPTPADFRGHVERDGTLTLRWTPAKDGSSPLATILLVNGIATASFAPGVDETNLGAFDPGDMRTFSVAAVGTNGAVGPETWKLRSTSLLAGKTLAEAEATLLSRGLRLGKVSGTGSVVVEPRAALLVPLEHAVDIVLGDSAPPQTKLAFDVTGPKTFSRKVRGYVAVRIKVSRAAEVTADLVRPRGERVHRWRFHARGGAAIVRLTMPARVWSAGRYRLVFSVVSGREVVRRTITLRVLGPRDRDVTAARALVDVVLAGNAGVARDLALGLKEKRVRVTAASGDDDAFGLAGSRRRNVRVMVVDADRYGVGLVRDLATVFPGMRILALTNDPRRLAQAIRAGATIAVPRSTPPKELARLIARLARR